MDIQPNMPTRTRTRIRRALAVATLALSLLTLLLSTGASGAPLGGSPPPQPAPQQALSASPLDGYIAGVARAWEPYTTPDGDRKSVV